MLHYLDVGFSMNKIFTTLPQAVRDSVEELRVPSNRNPLLDIDADENGEGIVRNNKKDNKMRPPVRAGGVRTSMR